MTMNERSCVLWQGTLATFDWMEAEPKVAHELPLQCPHHSATPALGQTVWKVSKWHLKSNASICKRKATAAKIHHWVFCEINATIVWRPYMLLFLLFLLPVLFQVLLMFLLLSLPVLLLHFNFNFHLLLLLTITILLLIILNFHRLRCEVPQWAKTLFVPNQCWMMSNELLDITLLANGSFRFENFLRKAAAARWQVSS